LKSVKRKKLIAINLVLCGIIIGLTAGLIIDKLPSGGIKTVEAGKVDALDMQYTFRSVAEESLPFVVEIMTVDVNVQEMPKGYSWPFNFIDPEEGDGDEVEKKEYETEGLGSGIIVRNASDNYYVLTNNHVIANADRISVRLFNKDIIDAEITGTDERKDLALIHFKYEGKLKTAVLGDSDKLHVGDLVLAVGSPLGYEATVTAGIVSALGRSGPIDNISDFIQTDASINQGNSGGALVNLNGEVIGINTWIATTTGVSIGLGFSIPVNNVKKAIDDFIESGSVQYGWLGVSLTEPDELTSEQLGIQDFTGALVQNIYFDSPAGRAGLQPGDYIIRLNDAEISDYRHFTRLIGDIKAGQTISMRVVRLGKIIEIDALIEARKSKEEIIQLYDTLWPGITAIPLDSRIKKELELSDAVHGVIITVDTGTGAFLAGLKDYDIITAINGSEINNILDFYAMINDKSNKYKFKIIRNSIEMYVELELTK